MFTLDIYDIVLVVNRLTMTTTTESNRHLPAKSSTPDHSKEEYQGANTT